MEHRWAVDEATGLLLYGGAEPYDCEPGLSPTQRRVALDHAPDPRAERYDFVTTSLRVATVSEISAWDAAQQTRRAHEQFGDARREVAALLWLLVEHINPPATAVKFRLLREQLVDYYVGTPWK